MNAYLKAKVQELLPELENDVQYYAEVVKVTTLCLVTLFNRKRGGDEQRITVNNYEQAIEAQNAIPYDDEIRSS
jgi:MinD superfamily P-loop ATPase